MASDNGFGNMINKLQVIGHSLVWLDEFEAVLLPSKVTLCALVMPTCSCDKPLVISLGLACKPLGFMVILK